VAWPASSNPPKDFLMDPFSAFAMMFVVLLLAVIFTAWVSRRSLPPAKPSPWVVADAIRIHKEKLSKQFEQRVNAEVRRRIDTADDFARKELARVKEENLAFTRQFGQFGVFTRAEYKQLLMCVHPDNTASTEVRNRLIDIIVRNESRLIRTMNGTRASSRQAPA
jgi:hypothetical protein